MKYVVAYVQPTPSLDTMRAWKAQEDVVWLPNKSTKKLGLRRAAIRLLERLDPDELYGWIVFGDNAFDFLEDVFTQTEADNHFVASCMAPLNRYDTRAMLHGFMPSVPVEGPAFIKLGSQGGKGITFVEDVSGWWRENWSVNKPFDVQEPVPEQDEYRTICYGGYVLQAMKRADNRLDVRTRQYEHNPVRDLPAIVRRISKAVSVEVGGAGIIGVDLTQDGTVFEVNSAPGVNEHTARRIINFMNDQKVRPEQPTVTPKFWDATRNGTRMERTALREKNVETMRLWIQSDLNAEVGDRLFAPVLKYASDHDRLAEILGFDLAPDLHTTLHDALRVARIDA